jgi:hypothetical protein
MGHVIKKQILDLSVQQSPDLFQVQHALSHWYWNQLLPLLEKAFDELAPSGEVIQINSLQIDLGQIDPARFRDPNWTAMLQQSLVEELKKAIRDQTSINNPVLRLHPVLQAGHQWLYYMEQGILPWNLHSIPVNWLEDVLTALATDIGCIDRLRKMIRENRSVLLRIIRQHNNAFITSLIKVLTARHQPPLDDVLKELILVYEVFQPGASAIQPTSIRREQWLKHLLQTAAITSHQFDLNKTLTELVYIFIQKNNIKDASIDKLLVHTPLLGPSIKSILRESPAYDNRRFSIHETISEPDPVMDPSEEPARQDDGNREGSYDGLYTGMAGLVLLHPFLNMLFTQLNWVEKGAFKNKACQQRAIGMLHFMATGQTTASEFALVIAKLLCGYPLKEPVLMEFEFSEEELEEALHLLTVVIGKWEVLKRTSIEGLREGFLQRKGKLTEQESGILLQVERGSIDLLLDQLPWNISMIKLPWMNRLLRVDWR